MKKMKSTQQDLQKPTARGYTQEVRFLSKEKPFYEDQIPYSFKLRSSEWTIVSKDGSRCATYSFCKIEDNTFWYTYMWNDNPTLLPKLKLKFSDLAQRLIDISNISNNGSTNTRSQSTALLRGNSHGRSSKLHDRRRIPVKPDHQIIRKILKKRLPQDRHPDADTRIHHQCISDTIHLEILKSIISLKRSNSWKWNTKKPFLKK